jgi:hypothetical protein
MEVEILVLNYKMIIRDTLKVQTIFFENVTKFKSGFKVKLVRKYLGMENVNMCCTC